MILDEEFVNHLCSCEECSQVFDKCRRHYDAIDNMTDEEKKLLNNLEGNLNEEEEDTQEENKE